MRRGASFRRDCPVRLALVPSPDRCVCSISGSLSFDLYEVGLNRSAVEVVNLTAVRYGSCRNNAKSKKTSAAII